MSSSNPPSPTEVAEQFERARRSGERVSIDQVLDDSEGVADREATRAEVVRILGRRLRESTGQRPMLPQGDPALPAGSSGAGPGLTPAHVPPPELPGYEIIDLIGRGGMGVVWEAYQTATGRRVAVKFLNDSSASTEMARQRFEREVELLARLQHPNIVSIVDSGVHSGRYFYAMDYVEGRPLDEALAPGSCDVRQALELMATIAEAVDFAHQRGVLHRDLKPGNILVVDDESSARAVRAATMRERSTLDERQPLPYGRGSDRALNPQPKVLDFGLAKAMDPGHAGSSVYQASLSEPGQLLGTLAYMPPEQSRGRLAEMSVRSDVYALGAVAYELLTGRLPVAIDGALGDVLARIANQDPPIPSSVRPSLSADIDAILFKALQKSPDRRYATAADFAADVRRHLSDQPVLARPDTFGYRARKFIRRNLVAVIGVAATIGALAVGLAVSLAMYFRAESARRDAERNQEETQQVAVFQSSMLEGISPEAMGLVMRKELRRQVEQGLVDRWIEGSDGRMRRLTKEEMQVALDQFDSAVSPANSTDVARELIDASLLKPTMAAIKTDFADQPVVAAKLHETLGQIYCSLGLYGKAEPLFRECLQARRLVHDEHHPDVAAALNNLALCLKQQGNAPESVKLAREAIAITRAGDGEMESLATHLSNLGAALMEAGDLTAAESALVEALSLRRRLLGVEHVDVATSLNNLAALRMARGDYQDGARLMHQALAILRKRLGDDHRDVAAGLSNLSQVYHALGDYEAAEPLIREALTLTRKLVGDEHPDVAVHLNNLAEVRRSRGDLAQAESLHRQALALRRSSLGVDHPLVAEGMNNLAGVLSANGDAAGAEALYRQSLDLLRKVHGEEHPVIAAAWDNLAMVLREHGNWVAAEPLSRRSLEMRRKLLGNDHTHTAQGASNLALILRDKGDDAGAEPLLREALAIYEKSLPVNHPSAMNSRGGLGRVLLKLARFSEAEPLLLRVREQFFKDPASSPQRLDRATVVLVELYRQWAAVEPNKGHDLKAAEWEERLREWRSSTQPATRSR